MTLDQARKKYPDLPVISQVEQLQEFTEDETGYIFLPRAIIAVDLKGCMCCVAAQSIVCDGVRFGDYNIFEDLIVFGRRCKFGTGNKFGDINRFGAGNNFGNNNYFGTSNKFSDGCLFGTGNRFGMPVNINNTDYTHVHRVGCIGSRHSSTYFFMNNDSIYVCCGCYNGSIDDFVERVYAVHKYNVLYLSQYCAAIADARKKHQELFKNKEV